MILLLFQWQCCIIHYRGGFLFVLKGKKNWSVFQVPCTLRRKTYQCATCTSTWDYVSTTWPDKDSTVLFPAIWPFPLHQLLMEPWQGPSLHGGILRMPSLAGALLTSAYAARRWMWGDRMVCQPTWATASDVMSGKKTKYPEVCLVGQMVSVWTCGAGLQSSCLGDERGICLHKHLRRSSAEHWPVVLS